MTTLQKVVFGAASDGSQGDNSRAAFTKVNANTDVLNAQAALTSAAPVTTAQALTAAHVGKRVNISLASAGTVNLPPAATMGADGIIYLRNTGATLVTLAIATGSGDTIAITKLQPGEAVVLDSDGVHAIGCYLRGRTNSDNEVVNGNCLVSGNETVSGTLTVVGGIVGAADGSSAPAGAVGERKVAAQSSGSISSGAVTAVTSIQLTPGEWDITANCRFIPTASQTPSEFVVGVSTVSNNFGDFSSYSSSYSTYGAGGGANIPTPVVTANVTVNTTVYVVVRSTFSGGGVMSVQGGIRARRVR